MQVHGQAQRQADGRFPPGVSGNPDGRERIAQRRARIAAKVEGWVAELGGKVGAAEREMLQRAAELSMHKPQRNEDAVRTANTISKLLAQAGFNRHRKRRESAEQQVPLRDRIGSD